MLWQTLALKVCDVSMEQSVPDSLHSCMRSENTPQKNSRQLLSFLLRIRSHSFILYGIC